MAPDRCISFPLFPSHSTSFRHVFLSFRRLVLHLTFCQVSHFLKIISLLTLCWFEKDLKQNQQRIIIFFNIICFTHEPLPLKRQSDSKMNLLIRAFKDELDLWYAQAHPQSHRCGLHLSFPSLLTYSSSPPSWTWLVRACRRKRVKVKCVHVCVFEKEGEREGGIEREGGSDREREKVMCVWEKEGGREE